MFNDAERYDIPGIPGILNGLKRVGDVLFEGDLRGAGIVSRTNDIGLGAGLRISQGKRPDNKLEGDTDWKRIEYPIQVEGLESDVELVCELRALRGDVWIDADSLRVRRLKNP